MNTGYLIISTDGGYNWTLKKFDLEASERFLKILVTENNIYIRGVQTLYKLDRNVKVVKSIKNSVFKPTLNKFVEGNPDEVVKPINNYFDDDIYLFNRKILLSSESFFDSGFVAVDTSLDNFELVNLVEYFPSFKGYEGFLKVMDFKDTKIFRINQNLYTTDSIFSKFNYFYKDTLFMNFDTSYEVYKKWLFYGFPDYYFTINDTLYIAKRRDSTKYDTIGPSKYIAYYQFNIYSVKKYLSNPKDTFVAQGNPFYDVYNGYFYTNGELVDPYLSTRINTPSLAVNDSFWVFTNRNKFLFITTDKGYNWRLISYLAGVPRVILNDTTFFFVLQDNEITEVNRTTDGGITFLPSKNFLEGYTNRIPITCFYTLPYFFIDSTGRGFLKGLNKHEKCNRIYQTYNFWETYHYTSDKFLSVGTYSPYKECSSSNIVRVGNFYFVAANCEPFSQNQPYYSRFIVLDTSLLNGREIILNWGLRILHLLPSNSGNNFICFALVQDTTNLTKELFEIRLTNDTGKTFLTLHRIVDSFGEILQFYQHNSDSVFFTTSFPDRLYLYDRINNQLKILWKL
ncbi:hypothetical protein D9V84_10215 [Bacteroidetes/Chlorobi group bacterium Naka2016]|jgi:hypothetical protein|nr:MAG: hypothetical protein D9V84_10215 [Bacteroidetes/Chlorobi group bacterium Naka2016]